MSLADALEMGGRCAEMNGDAVPRVELRRLADLPRELAPKRAAAAARQEV